MQRRPPNATLHMPLGAGILFMVLLTADGGAAQRAPHGGAARWAPSVRAAVLVHAPTAPVAPAVLRAIPAQEPDESPMAGMTGSGFFLGIIGMLAGTTVGSALAGSDCRDECRRDRGASGALIGGSLFIPLGVHIANPEPGSLPAATGASALLGSAMWFLVATLPGDPMPLAPFLAAPLQLQAAIAVEQWIR